jgi:16S rRNA (cytidine1402-2'-O)-methyltransferase
VPAPEAGSAGGTLYVVATPIGNLGDMTIRAIEVLRSVPLIAAEDTRVTRRLLARYEIATHATSFHARSGPKRLAELLTHLRGGGDLALVTDAGTPTVSDPGSDLVAAWAGNGGIVVPIPGPSAVLAAVAASAIAGPRWGFEGFLPRTGRDRKERLARIAAEDRATIFFEAPTRLAATVRDLVAACGPDRPAEVGRELTKLHEQIARGTLAELAAALAGGTIPARGEVVMIVAGRAGSATDTAAVPSIAEARKEVAALVRAGSSRTDAAREVAAATGLSRRELYRWTDRD